jgi:IclR family transcriptional regulator, KDG regulon repressor
MSDSRGEEGRQETVQSVLRACRLLTSFSHENSRLGLAQLATRTQLSKPTAYRLLHTLEVAGFISRSADGLYQPTMQLFKIGSAILEKLDVRVEARPIMSELATRTGETVYLGVEDDLRAVCLERVDGDGPIRLMVWDVGGSLPLYVGGAPTVLLAFREEELLPRVLAEPPFRLTPNTVTDPEGIRAKLRQIRTNGYSFGTNDITPGVGAIAAPVFDQEGRAAAALSIGGLSKTLEAQRESLCEQVVAAAMQISMRLGFRA